MSLLVRAIASICLAVCGLASSPSIASDSKELDRLFGLGRTDLLPAMTAQ